MRLSDGGRTVTILDDSNNIIPENNEMAFMLYPINLHGDVIIDLKKNMYIYGS
jgi:hypothetical protein